MKQEPPLSPAAVAFARQWEKEQAELAEQRKAEQEKQAFIRDHRAWAAEARKRGYRGDEEMARYLDERADNMEQRGTFTVNSRINADPTYGPRAMKYQSLRTRLNYAGANVRSNVSR